MLWFDQLKGDAEVTQIRSPDAAQRNPGAQHETPRIPLALHPGYLFGSGASGFC